MADSTGPSASPAAVFLDYDQAGLDRCYDQAHWAPNMADVHRRAEIASAAAIERLGGGEWFAYGESANERLILFRAKAANAPVFIHIHGGAWRAGAATRSCAPAEMIVAAGAHYVALDFINVDEAGGSLFPMVEQARRAVAWVWRNAERLRADPARIFVHGHSSGAHLAGNVLTTDWPALFDAPADLLRGGMVTSGMYELAPVRLSARSKYVRFTDAMVDALSSIRHLHRLHCPIVVSVGDCESPEFQRQNRAFAAAIEATGKPVTLQIAAGFNHFEIGETLASPYGTLGCAALTLMGLR